jgi:uroporphyrinogen decarboxylase
MSPLTSFERIKNTLDRKPVDRIGKFESFWPETITRWRQEGHVRDDESLEDHFDLDIRGAGWPNLVADLDFTPVVVEETDETVLRLDGNGATLRWMKRRSMTPEHVDFKVKDRAAWEELIKPNLLDVDPRRIDFEGYRHAREMAARNNRFFVWTGIAPFECIHPVCGHEYMLMGMVEDPEWVIDMVLTYARLTLALQAELFAKCGQPDAIWYFEDMGFKNKPFMSPAMYRSIVQPGHKLLFDDAHARGLRVIVHSCGFVEPLVPGLVEAGMDCLQAMEVKAGMDMLRIAERFGDRISFMGNLDARALISNDRARIDAEMDKKIRPMLASGHSFVLHTDHSVPSEVDYETMCYWFERGVSYSERKDAA